MILENDLKIHIFLESVESAVASAPASRFKDPALMYTSSSADHLQCRQGYLILEYLKINNVTRYKKKRQLDILDYKNIKGLNIIEDLKVNSVYAHCW